MITEGKQDCNEWDDDWTVVTMDGGRAAQFEHTVLTSDQYRSTVFLILI